MNSCTGKVIDWMVHCNVISEKERELYQYALDSAVIQILPLFLAGIIGFCFGSISQGIVMVLPFMILRKYCGGFHSIHLWNCLIGSCLLLILCTFICTRLKYSWLLLLITAIGTISLIRFSPIDNDKRVLDVVEKNHFNRMLKICLFVIWMLAIIIFQIGMYQYTVSLSFGVLLTAGLQIPCLLQEVKKNQKTQ